MKQNLMQETMKEIEQSRSSIADSMKEKSLELFNSLPMPKERDEDWRYTNIDKFDLQKFPILNPKSEIFVRGLDDESVSKGVILTDINSGIKKYPHLRGYFSKNAENGNDKFRALNSAFFSHGYFLYAPKNVEIKEPIRIRIIASPTASVYRNVIIAESGSRVQIVEECSAGANDAELISSGVAEVFANDGSKVTFCHVNEWSAKANSFTDIIGRLERDSSIDWICACFGGRMNRLRIDTIFNGKGSSCSNLGIFMGKGKEHIDFTTNMHHNSENTTNDVLVDGILRDESTSVYRGLIKIEKEAQKTNSYLANHILKIGEKTLANSIPSLKIDANDVKASHGVTVGQINNEHLFYLMARGLSRDEAEKLIVEGFFEPIIEKIPLEELREKIRVMVKR